MIKELECIFVRKFDHRVLQRSYLLEHLTCDLRVETDCAMLELVEGRVKSFIDVQKFLFHSFNFRFILDFPLLESNNLLLNFSQVRFSSFDILLGLH